MFETKLNSEKILKKSKDALGLFTSAITALKEINASTVSLINQNVKEIENHEKSIANLEINNNTLNDSFEKNLAVIHKIEEILGK